MSQQIDQIRKTAEELKAASPFKTRELAEKLFSQILDLLEKLEGRING